MSFPAPKTVFPDVCAVTTAELIEAYRESIEMMRASCQTEIDAHKAIEKADPNFGDDLYLLRYVLSYHKNGPEECWKALFATMQWRQKHQEVLYSVRVKKEAPPNDAIFRAYAPVAPHFSTKDGHLIYIVRNGTVNGAGALEKLTTEEVTTWLIFSKEWIHSHCDDETRATGKLIKMVTVLDFSNITLAACGGPYKEALDRASKTSEQFYPQLLHKSAVFNIPFFFRAIISLLLKVTPKSVQEKVVICGESEGEGMVKWCGKHLKMDVADVPTFLGGKCDCEGGCVKGVLNTHDHMLTKEEAESIKIAPWSEFIAKTQRTA